MGLGDLQPLPCLRWDIHLPAPRQLRPARLIPAEISSTKDKMLCKLRRSYFNSRHNYFKQQLRAWRDADTDVSKIPAEGEAAERRGLWSVAPRDCPDLQRGSTHFVDGGGG